MIKLSFLNIFRRKSRATLSIVGMLIGLSAMVVLTALVDGTYNDMLNMVSMFQGVIVMEKDAVDPMLSKVDVSVKDKLESISGVRVVVPEIWGVPSKFEGESLGLSNLSLNMVFLYGVDVASYERLRGNGWLGDLYAGSMLKPGERSAVVIGKKLAEDYSKGVGSTLTVNGKRFRVKGILKTESDMLGGIIVMPIEDARELVVFPENKVSSFYVELMEPEKDKQMAKKIEFVLGGNLEANTSSDFSAQINSMLGNFRLVALFLGLLAALVAGIGIANTVLMNVLDRTAEIGTLRALGWTSFDVLKMVLLESTFLALIGSVLGIGFGVLLSIQLGNAGLQVLVTPQLLITTFMFGLAVGILAGLYPAYRASTMDPIKAIRGA
jgi:putative ABC transport system permease protein